MTQSLESITATLEGYKAIEVNELKATQALDQAALENIVVSICVRLIADKLTRYHRARQQLLSSTNQLHRLGKIDTFEKWLTTDKGNYLIADRVLLRGIGSTWYVPGDVAEEAWKSLLPGVVKLLNDHPAAASLPKIVLQTNIVPRTNALGRMHILAFSIQFATS